MTDKEKIINLLNELDVKYKETNYGLVIDDSNTHSHEEICIEVDEDGKFVAFASY